MELIKTGRKKVFKKDLNKKKDILKKTKQEKILIKNRKQKTQICLIF